MVNSLSRWLKKTPQPKSVRYTTEDGEERTLAIGSNQRKWKEAESALVDSGAVRVECLAEDGTVLRIETLREVEDDKAPAGEVAKARETAALAVVLDAQGKRINEAFLAGADAASRGQENLVNVVNILTAQWSAPMNALQSASMNLAKLARQAGASPGDEDDDGMSQQMQQLMGLAMMKFLGSSGVEMPGMPQNGAAKKEK